MRCEEAEELIYQRETSSFDPDNEAFDAHLLSCKDCASLYRGVIQLERGAQTWEDEAVPRWDRSTVGVVQAPKWSWFQSGWVPLVACVLLSLLIVFRAEVSMDDQGWRLSFAPSQTQPQIQEELVKIIDAALVRAKEDNAEQVRTLLAGYQQDQETHLNEMLIQIQSENQKLRQEDFTRLVKNWQEQRRDDIFILDHKINTLYTNQQKQSKDLINIANFVSRGNNKKVN